MATNRKLYDFPIAVASGIDDYNSVVNIFGYNSAATTAFRVLWEKNSDYTPPSSAQQMQVKSTSASDTMNLLIQGLDSNYDVLNETVTLTGTSVVTTTNSFYRINNAIILSGSNVGNIDIGNDLVGTPTYYAAIRAGDGKTQMSHYTVPRGYCFFLYRIDAFSADSTADKPAIFRNRVTNSAGRVLTVARTTFDGNMNIQRRFPFKYDEKTDIAFQGSTTSGSHEVGIFAEGLLAEQLGQTHLNNLSG